MRSIAAMITKRCRDGTEPQSDAAAGAGGGARDLSAGERFSEARKAL
jgi:hypothetical protein